MTTEDLLADDKTQQDLDYLEELTGPGKKFDRSKYSDEAEMYKAIAKGKYESDRFIDFKNREFDVLKTDHDKLREDNMAGASLREILDQLKSQQLASSDTTNAKEVNQEPAFDPKKIEDLVDQRMTAAERSRKQQENFTYVRNTLKEQFGDNHAAVLKQQIEDLDLTPDYVNDLARNNPKVLLKLIGVGERKGETFQALPRGNQFSQFAPRGEVKRDWAFYEKMRKENPNQYRDPKTQVQMHKDAIALKDAFGIPQD